MENSLTQVCKAQKLVYVFRKAINKVNESFQTHNGGAIIERRMLSAGAEASGHLLFTQVFLACIWSGAVTKPKQFMSAFPSRLGRLYCSCRQELDWRRKQCLTHLTRMTNSWLPHIFMETAATAGLGTNSELCVSVSLIGARRTENIYCKGLTSMDQPMRRSAEVKWQQ